MEDGGFMGQCLIIPAALLPCHTAFVSSRMMTQSIRPMLNALSVLCLSAAVTADAAGSGDFLAKFLGRSLRIGGRPRLTAISFYGWIWSVQRNCQVAIALIATETVKSETSGTDIFAGPLPVSKRNIQGSNIMA